MDEFNTKLKCVKNASTLLSISTLEERNRALESIYRALNKHKDEIFLANSEDVSASQKEGIKSSLLSRLHLTESKLESALDGIIEVSKLPDPTNKILEKRELDSSLILEKRTFPIGVIALIFEARPDALIQIVSLALKSGNGIILKGGKEAIKTNLKLVEIIKEAVKDYSFGSAWILYLEKREEVPLLFNANGLVDLIIPRGSNEFVKYVMSSTTIPVLGHADGICMTYVDKDADIEKALKICFDAKTQYPAACNATETILVHASILKEFLPRLNEAFREKKVIVHADERALVFFPEGVKATKEDWDKEYLALECAIKTVDSIGEAINHIAEHGSHHTDAIITENEVSAKEFIQSVDSADVFVNCSTRFADGYRFGLGAEVGISTSKLHARGPVGLMGLVTTRYILSGHGDIVEPYAKGEKTFSHKELL